MIIAAIIFAIVFAAALYFAWALCRMADDSEDW